MDGVSPLHRDADYLWCSHEDDQTLAPGDAGVEEIPLEHHVMLRVNGDDDGRKLAALTLVDAHSVGGHQLVKLSEVVDDNPSVEIHVQFGFVEIHLFNDAQIAVEHVLLVIILGLQNLVPDTVGVAESLDLRFVIS